jgi:hypothetical protein
MEAGHPAQEVVVSIQALCRLSPRALDLGLLQPRLDGPNDARGDLVLKVKNVVQRAVEAIGPVRPPDLVPVGNSILLATDIESGDAPALCERSVA